MYHGFISNGSSWEHEMKNFPRVRRPLAIAITLRKARFVSPSSAEKTNPQCLFGPTLGGRENVVSQPILYFWILRPHKLATAVARKQCG
jgi:hypothetical protein